MFVRSIRCAAWPRQALSQRSYHRSDFQKNFFAEPELTRAKPALWKRVVKYSFILGATGAAAIFATAAYSLYDSLLARKYVTREDMDDYRSMDRNIFEYSIEDMEEELMESAIDVDEQISELREEREPHESSYTNSTRSAEARSEMFQLLKTAFFGSDLERNRAWNDHYSFYYTYIELNELQKMREDGYEWGTKETEKKWW